MSMDQPRRPTRAPGGAGRAPRSASPAIAVVVALLAAVLGFVILRALDDDETVATNGGTSTEQTTATDVGAVTTPVATTTTVAPVDKSAFKVLVANASGVQGSAGALTDQLAALGYQTLEAANAVDPTPQPTTVVYYFSTAQAQGEDVSRAIGLNGLAQVLPATLPVEQAAFAEGTVLIMLGTDLAGQPIPTTVAAAAVTQPTVAGGASPNETTVATG